MRRRGGWISNPRSFGPFPAFQVCSGLATGHPTSGTGFQCELVIQPVPRNPVSIAVHIKVKHARSGNDPALGRNLNCGGAVLEAKLIAGDHPQPLKSLVGE